MNINENQNKNKTPWHLWVIGILSFLWNAIGVMDFVMTQTKNEAYMENYTPAQLEFFYGFPIWLVLFWGIAVCGGVIGSFLLLFRTKFAVPILLASFVSMLITTIHNFGFSNGMEVIGDPLALVFSGIIFIVALLLYIYARAMQSNGVLK